MNNEKFTEVLSRNGIPFQIKGGRVVVRGGYVYLRSLTSLPEGVTFENGGYVDLDSLTSLLEGVTFENGGYVYLRSLTSLPEGVTFENGGYVDLESLTGKHVYAGEEREFRWVDGYTMILTSSRESGGATIHRARYFRGGPIQKMPACYVAEAGGLYAHGASIKEAVEDLEYKRADAADKATVASEVRDTGKVTLAQFRALTGACREGIRQHLSGQGIDLNTTESMTLPDALKAMAGTSYGDTFSEYVGGDTQC